MKKKIIFVSGNFNILHPGHLRLLQFAKKLGSYLVVGVNNDTIAGKSAYIKQNLRINNVKNLNFVNEVILIKNLKSTILKIKPDTIVKGKEFRYKDNEESLIVKKIKTKLVFSSGDHNYFSKNLLKKEFYNSTFDLELTKDYLVRNKINTKHLVKTIKKIKNINVCVIGDIIVDEYIQTNMLGLSNEEPCMVLNPTSQKKFIGGAGIVASHASSLGAKTYLFSVVGKDENTIFVKNELKKNKVNSFLYKDTIRPTTLKQRFKVENNSQIKISYLSQEPISNDIQKKIINRLKVILKNTDLLIFSDFNYGCLPQQLVNKILKIAKENNVLVTADSQSSSQIGDIARFKGVNMIAPTEREARVSVKNDTDGLVILATKLQQTSKSENIILTLGSDGVLIFSTSKNKENKIDKLPALNNNPKDISGSGDSLLVMSSLFLALNSNIWEASLMGSLSAALQSSTIGNQPIKLSEIINLIYKLKK